MTYLGAMSKLASANIKQGKVGARHSKLVSGILLNRYTKRSDNGTGRNQIS